MPISISKYLVATAAVALACVTPAVAETELSCAWWQPNYNVEAAKDFFKSATSDDVQRCLATNSEAGVNVRDTRFNATPLHVVSYKGSHKVAQALIAKGADVDAIANGVAYHAVPLHVAAVKGRVETTQALIAGGADVHARDSRYGAHPLHAAAYKGRPAIADLLIAAGADVNAADNGGWVPLHYAAGRGQVAVMELLIQHGADVNAKTKQGITVLDWAEKNRKSQSVAFLKKAEAQPSNRNRRVEK